MKKKLKRKKAQSGAITRTVNIPTLDAQYPLDNVLWGNMNSEATPSVIANSGDGSVTDIYGNTAYATDPNQQVAAPTPGFVMRREMRGTGRFTENPLVKNFNILATGITGFANMIQNNRLRNQEERQMLEAMEPRYYQNMEGEGLNNLPMYTQYGGSTYGGVNYPAVDGGDENWLYDGLYHNNTYGNVSMYQAGGDVSPAKAKEILKDGKIRGKKLTAKQKRFFGWVAGGKKQTGGDSTILPAMEGQADPNATAVVLYMPKDTRKKVKLVDNREINPATGKPFKQKGNKTISVDPVHIQTIVAHAKAKGIDPYTALAIAYQETEFDKNGIGYGEVKDYFPDQYVGEEFLERDEMRRHQEANKLANALKDKLAYATRLGYDKKGEDFVLQAYNGYGKIKPPKGQDTSSYYGIPISNTNPLDMSKNPAYGKTVLSLRDQVLKNNPEIKKLVESTPAYASRTTQTSDVAMKKAGGKIKFKKAQTGTQGFTPTNNREDYYKASATLAYYKGLLNDKLKAKNPQAFSNYFQELGKIRRTAGNTSQQAMDFVQNSQFNDYLTPEEVQNTLGKADYERYLQSLAQVNQFNIQQGQQPLYGDIEGKSPDLKTLNYGRRFASLQVNPSLVVSNQATGATYNRQYTYNPATGNVDFTETGDISLRPSYVTAPAAPGAQSIAVRQAGGGLPETYGLPDGMAQMANVNAEEGEVFQDMDGEIMKVADDAGTHEEGGVELSNVDRVLEQTSTKRKDRASKLLALSPEEVEQMFGFKPKRKISHADAYEQAVDHYGKKRMKIQKNQEVINERPIMDKYSAEAARLNFEHLANLPTEDDVFDMLFGHQEYVKELNGINDDGSINKSGTHIMPDGTRMKNSEMKCGGKRKKMQLGGNTDLGLYRGPQNRSGRNLYSPTGKTTEAKLTDQQIVDAYRAAGIELGNLRGKELQGAIYNYLIDNQPEVLQEVLKEYGPNIQSEQMGLANQRAFVDPMRATPDDLRVVLPGLLDAMPGARIPLPSVATKTTSEYPVTVAEQPSASSTTVGNRVNPNVVINPNLKQQPENRFYERTYWDELAPGLISLADSMVRDPELYNPMEFNQLNLKLLDPTPALTANQGDYEAAANALANMPIGSGASVANLANLSAQKYKVNANILGEYANRNAAIKNQEIMYNTQVRDRQAVADAQTREKYYRNVQVARDNQRLQRLKAIEDLGRIIQLKRRQNRSGNLLLKVSPAFDQYGEYNGYQYMPVLPSNLGYSQPPTPTGTTTKGRPTTTTKTTTQWKIGDRTIKREVRE